MDILNLNALEIRGKLLNKEISSVEIIKAYFKRIGEVEKDINAFISIEEDKALKAAEKIDEKIRNNEDIGILAGLPIGIKDNVMMKGTKTTAGSKMLENFQSFYDATVVKRIKDEDGIIIGKNNMDEFAMGSSTETSYFGPSRNPIDLERVPGGSSGGSAAAVKAKEAVLSLGTDTGGSVRQPAAYCDIVGYLPSYGTISRYGIIPMANTLDQVGILARDVLDVSLLFSVISGYDELDPTSNKDGSFVFNRVDHDRPYLKDKRIALPKEYMEVKINERVKSEFFKAIKNLEDLGAKIEEVSLPYSRYSLATYNIVSNAEVSSNLARYDGVRYGYRAENYKDLDDLYINTRTEGFGQEVKRRISIGTYYLSKDNISKYYEKALKMRTLLINEYRKIFSKYDFIISPTTSTLPFKFGEKMEDPISMYKSDYFTVGANLAGLCAISIPCHSSPGLPVGLQIVGNRNHDLDLLKAGLSFERMVK